MSLTVLSVAFPFARVTEDAVGGAEQVVAQLDRALVAAGHRSLVAAAEGSRVAGELLPVSVRPGLLDARARAEVHARMRATIAGTLAATRVDVLHFHGLDFDHYLPTAGPPALVTLHLPIGWYSPAALRPARPGTWLQPVSTSQARAAPADLALLPVIENGVDVDAFPRLRRKGRFALVLGRICPEKGITDALDAARLAGERLLVAGSAYPWPEHQRYLLHQVVPRLDSRRHWIGPVAGERKRRLLAAARCVVVPSRAPETSSLVAMEALAAGTPVIARRTGALPDIVDHGRTGFVVDDVAGLAAALHEVERIRPDDCRAAARERFPLGRTNESYLALHARLAACGVEADVAPQAGAPRLARPVPPGARAAGSGARGGFSRTISPPVAGPT